MNSDTPRHRPEPPHPRRSRRRRALVLSVALALGALGAHATYILAEATDHDSSHTLVSDLPDQIQIVGPSQATVTVPHHITAMTIDHLHVPDTRELLRRHDRL